MYPCLGGELVDQAGDRLHQVRGGKTAEQAEIERDLVVARAPRVQRGTGRGDLGQAPFDCGVDVLVGLAELELALVQLALDAAKAAFDQREARPGQETRREQAARVRDAAGDVKRVQLEIRLQGRRESLELRVEGLAEATTPQLAYGVSLFTSPSRLPSSRACS
jgi:hypothetical protein